jgi:hypothetical protein
MENLNKRNFWDAMVQKYPLAVAGFLKWVDDYKTKVDWETLFNHCGLIYVPDGRGNKTTTIERPAPKFHDLPLAMQMGIWQEYLSAFVIDDCKTNIENFLYGLEEGLQQTKSTSGLVSHCCKGDMIPPDYEEAETMGSLWGAYAYYICKTCHNVCVPEGMSKLP